MARLLVMYKTPNDTAAFDKYYFATHAPIAKKIPGLRHYEVSRGAVASPAGASGVHLVAMLEFDDMAALQSGVGSAQGQAAVNDLPNFATGGVDILMYETKDV